MNCATCGAVAAVEARFCASCGHPLRIVDDERRVVTILFVDIVGFTSLSERLDPERVKNLVDQCFDRLAVDVTTFGGQVDKIVGDALIALFGAPVAHEDDAERAVRAALRMQETMGQLADELGEQVRVRIGVNTGEVLVGTMRAAGSVTAMGDVVNTASRLQTSAEPGEVVVGPATYRATLRTIAYSSPRLLAAKGREEPVDTWVAVAPTQPPGSRSRRVDGPLVGRDSEVSLLRRAVDTSMRHQRALLVLLVGDVGMGKSRLADEIARWSTETHESVIREGRCVPYGEANVWWPIAEALRSGLGLRDGIDPDMARTEVRGQVATVLRRRGTDAEVARTADGLLTLMGYEPDSNVDPAAAYEEAGRALGAYAAASSQLRPIVFQLSDLHWADDALLELIDGVFGAIHHRPVVVLATARPALLDRWTPRPGRHNTVVLHLDPLEREAAAQLLSVLVGETLPAPAADALLDRSGGNPFYLEELVSLLDGEALAETGPMTALPDTLRGLVAARLDDLTPDQRSVLQDASVIGHTGPVVGLREMAREMDRHVDADAAVADLVGDEILERNGDMWSFRSDLVREVAYRMITKADRAESHLGIARYIEANATGGSGQAPWVVDQLAHHYATAVTLAAELGSSGRTARFPVGLADHARQWVVEAADRARRDHAIPAALRLYTQALDLIEASEHEPNVSTNGEREAEEVTLRLARARMALEAWDLATARLDVEAAQLLIDRRPDAQTDARLLVVRGLVEHREGHGSIAVGTLTRAVTCFADLGDDVGLGAALRERAMVQILDGSLDEAAGSARDALVVFERAEDRHGQGWAQQHLAWIAFVSGRIDDADRHLAAALQHFDALGDRRGMTWTEGLQAWVRFQQGRVPDASELAERVLEEAVARHDPWATAMMTLLVSLIRLWSGRTQEAVELAERSYRSFKGAEDHYGEGMAGAALGRALVMAGRVDEGFELLGRVGNADGRDGTRGPAGGEIARYALLATSVQIGEPGRARGVVEEMASTTGIGGDDPSVVLGLLAIQNGDLEEASRQLGTGADQPTGPNRGAALALLAAVARTGDAGRRADQVAAFAEATYLDRAVAEVAAALEAGGLAGEDADAGSTAGRHLAAAQGAVDQSQDAVARAFVAVAAARIAERLGANDLNDLAKQADRLTSRLGVDPRGWACAFDLAVGAGGPS